MQVRAVEQEGRIDFIPGMGVGLGDGAKPGPRGRWQVMDQDDLGIWTAPCGDLVAWFADPAGNTLSLTQFR